MLSAVAIMCFVVLIVGTAAARILAMTILMMMIPAICVVVSAFVQCVSQLLIHALPLAAPDQHGMGKLASIVAALAGTAMVIVTVLCAIKGSVKQAACSMNRVTLICKA
jgi:hypothetical protein